MTTCCAGATAEVYLRNFLASMARLRHMERKAPAVTSTERGKRCAEVPLTWLLGKVPELEEKGGHRGAERRDYRKLRCDGTHRRL